jgi:hypothetical protein
MSFRMYRVVCATPGDSEDDLERERQAFHEVLGEVNETEGMPLGILFVPVSVPPHMSNKTSFQPLVDDNVRACTFFVQVLHHTWGPPTRNFEHDYQLANACCADAQLPMEGVAVFLKAIEPGAAEFKGSASEFKSMDEFKTCLRSQLSAWLASKVSALSRHA